MDEGLAVYAPSSALVWGEVYGVEEISDPFPGRTYIIYARELVGKGLCRRTNLCAYLEVWVIFLYLCTRKRNERPSGDAGGLALRDL